MKNLFYGDQSFFLAFECFYGAHHIVLSKNDRGKKEDTTIDNDDDDDNNLSWHSRHYFPPVPTFPTKQILCYYLFVSDISMLLSTYPYSKH